jgi:hypothetical protein
MVYVTTNRDDVVVVDTRSMTIATRFEIPPWRGAHSLAIDKKHSRLFIGGRTRVTVLSAVDGHLLGDVDVGSRDVSVTAGGIAFRNGQAFATCGEENLAVVGQTEDGTFYLESKIEVPKGTRSLAMNEKSGAIYLPYVEAAAPAQRGQARFPMKVAVLEKK